MDPHLPTPVFHNYQHLAILVSFFFLSLLFSQSILKQVQDHLILTVHILLIVCSYSTHRTTFQELHFNTLITTSSFNDCITGQVKLCYKHPQITGQFESGSKQDAPVAFDQSSLKPLSIYYRYCSYFYSVYLLKKPDHCPVKMSTLYI